MKIKKKYLIVGLIIILLLILFILSLANPSSKKTTQPTPTSTVNGPTPIFPANIKKNPLYEKKGLQNLLQKMDERKSLSEDDIKAKNKILALLPSGKLSGIVYKSPTIRVHFAPTPNLFLVEILTVDLANAKQEGNAWFLSQGMSQDAICNYPVDFYLSWDVISKLKGKTVQFSPLGPGC